MGFEFNVSLEKVEGEFWGAEKPIENCAIFLIIESIWSPKWAPSYRFREGICVITLKAISDPSREAHVR